ncbi:MAG: M48 family metalloprotease [Chitinispirillaceae bacterium]|nr:M48 family metalloprotease [Chitinispirillaceae bacterium]
MTHSLPRFFMVAALVPFLFTCETLTDFFISDEDEVTLGNKFKKEILADSQNYPQYTKSSEVINYITTMGNRLVNSSSVRTNISFTFTLIDNDTMINAFAIPGGHVFVYTGLLKAAKSGAEVAGVIGHEIGHIAMRHGAKRLAQASAVEIVNQILLGDSSSAAGAVAQLCESLLFLKFSRDDEYQADSCAVAFTAAAAYNPYGMKFFFQTLMDTYGGGMGPFEVVSTHPDTQKRIDEVVRIAKKTTSAYTDGGTEGMYRLEFEAIKTKI